MGVIQSKIRVRIGFFRAGSVFGTVFSAGSWSSPPNPYVQHYLSESWICQDLLQASAVDKDLAGTALGEEPPRVQVLEHFFLNSKVLA